MHHTPGERGARLRVGSHAEGRLAAAKFSNLTNAELAFLEFADIGNLNHGDLAAHGPSHNPMDPSNDPKVSVEWHFVYVKKSRHFPRAAFIRVAVLSRPR